MSKRIFRFTLILSFILAIVEYNYAHVELTNPEGGETFNTNDTVLITWIEAQAHDTQNWELYFSLDAGDTWIIISQSIAVPLREFEWVVPEQVTNKGRIRVVQNNAELDYEDVSANFSIENATGLFDNYASDFESIYNYPNPFNYSTTISYELKQPETVQLSVYNHLGEQVEQIQQHQASGKQLITWNAEGLPQGVYFYTLKVDKEVATGKLVKMQ